MNNKHLIYPSSTNDIARENIKALSDGFAWRDRNGGYHVPENMETRHLFHVVRMIWNHTIPFKLVPYSEYVFGSFYTRRYMVTAVRVMIPEIATREDIADEWKADLNLMVNWLATNQLHKPENLRALVND